MSANPLLEVGRWRVKKGGLLSKWDRYMWSGLPSRFVTGLQVDQRGMRACVSNKTSWCKIHTSAARMALLGREGKRSAVVPRLKTLGAFMLRCSAEACAQTALEHTDAHTHTQVRACICVSVSKLVLRKL